MPSTPDADAYNADYFLRGVATGKSLYENYRWIPHLTIPMAQAIVRYLRASPSDTFLDFGCARGYLVKALKLLGYNARGYEVSQWAIDNCDSEVSGAIFPELPIDPVDWIIAKDVLEHIEPANLHAEMSHILRLAAKGVFVVVPLAERVIIDQGAVRRYIVREYEHDVTHKIRRTYNEWLEFFLGICGDNFIIEGTVRVEGVKDNYFATHPAGNGFFTFRKK